jgi:hypothetical protein
MKMLLSAVHESAPGPQRRRPDATACPHPAKADAHVRAPGCVAGVPIDDVIAHDATHRPDDQIKINNHMLGAFTQCNYDFHLARTRFI